MGMLKRITDPYSSLESFGYDRWIAPGVASLTRRLLDPFLEALPPEGRLLDVGCGGGHLLRIMRERRPDASLVGLDLSPDQVRRARERARRGRERIEYVEGSALALPFPDRSFDAVVSVGSIKHWPDSRRGVSECARVLSPGGFLLLVEADRGCTLDAVRNFVSEWPMPRPARALMVPFFRTWVAGQSLDLDEARAALRGHGLVETSVRRVEDLPVFTMQGRRPRDASIDVT